MTDYTREKVLALDSEVKFTYFPHMIEKRDDGRGTPHVDLEFETTYGYDDVYHDVMVTEEDAVKIMAFLKEAFDL